MRQQPGAWLVVGAAVLALATAGCRDTRDDAARQTDRAGDQAGDAARGVADDVRDGWITTKIQAKYFADADVKGRNIDVSTNSGVVTLTGTVENDRARQHAINLARNTDGVTRVEDRLAVQAAGADTATRESAAADSTSPRAPAPGTIADGDAVERDREAEPTGTSGTTQPSAWITTKIHAKYFTDGTVKARNIDVSTNNGIVTLTGEVQTDQERQHAVKLAQETEGVRRVEDRLRIVPQTAGDAGAPAGRTDTAREDPARGDPEGGADAERMSDAGITARVQSKFFLDDRVRARNIDVDTREGVVTLSGEVISESEHQQALSLARSVDGVRDVQDQLKVTPGTARRDSPGDDTRGTAGTMVGTVEDTWVTTKIQSKYFLDDVVKAGRVDVTTHQGVVTLSGEVPSKDARQRAEALARDTEGVIRVENRLTVRPDAGGSDLPPVREPVRDPSQ